MLRQIIIVAFVCSAAVNAGPDDPLCQKYGAEHSTCLPDVPCNPSSAGKCGMTDADKEVILKAMNEERVKIVKGEEKRGYGGTTQPAGKGLYEITWSDELARVAQSYVTKKTSHSHDCSYSKVDGKYVHKCRRTPKYNLVGQNAAAGAASAKYDWNWAVNYWISEVNDYRFPEFRSPTPGKMVGHYKQVVWGDTNEVGCGAFSFDEPCSWHNWSFKCTQFLCNFGPPGNFPGAPYKTSGSCTKTSAKYPELCAA